MKSDTNCAEVFPHAGALRWTGRSIGHDTRTVLTRDPWGYPTPS